MKEEIIDYPKSLTFFIFLVGIVATFAYRVIIVLNFYSPYWVKVSWYIGTIGFMIYFGFRFEVQRRKANLAKDHDLLNVIKKSKIEKQEREVIEHIVKIVSSSKAKWNSLFIFLLSLVALILGILLDLGFISFG